MGFKIIPYTKNRVVIYDMLTRAKRFHCSVSSMYQFDITETLKRLRNARQTGQQVGLTALLIHATSRIIERYPRLNHHMFHGLLTKREVAFDHISCTVIVQRRSQAGESILLPVILRHTNQMSLEAIHQSIQHHAQSPLDSLPQFHAFERLKKLPVWALKFVSFKARSDPKFYEKYFGTYGLSSLVTVGWGPTSGASLANVASTFLPSTIRDVPYVVDGQIKVRKILNLGMIGDHYILDGKEILAAMKALKPLIENPHLS